MRVYPPGYRPPQQVSAPDMAFQRQRQEMLKMRLAEEAATRPIGSSGEPRLTVCLHNKTGTPVVWKKTTRDIVYDYYAIGKGQIVFDIGDDIEMPDGSRYKQSWADIVRETHLIWKAADLVLRDEYGFPNGQFWGALSGGKGTHTEVFIRPVRYLSVRDGHEVDLRKEVADTIVGVANEMLGIEAVLNGDGVHVDRLKVAPRHEASVVREFGTRKSPDAAHRKTLWMIGPGPIRPLPPTREEAYAQAGLKFPSKIVPSVFPAGAIQAAVRDALGVACPRGTECLPGADDKRTRHGICANCPLVIS